MLEHHIHSPFDRQKETRQKVESPNRFAYHSIIGLGEFPQSPDDLQPSFQLPQDIVISIADKAIRDHGKQEFSWDIDFDPESQSFIESKILSGRRSSVGLNEMGRMFLKGFFGMTSLAFVHNHPSGIHSPASSELVYLTANQRRAYMLVTCSVWGITCLTQTAQSMKTPFSSVLRSVMASDAQPTLETLPAVARRFGIGYYSWNVPANLANIGEYLRLSMQEVHPPVILTRQERKSSSHNYCLRRNSAACLY